MFLRYMLLSVLLAAGCAAGTAQAQATDGRQQQDIAQGEHCLRQMERDAHGAMDQARNMLAREGASDISRVMALSCLVRGQLMTGEGEAAQALMPELLPLLDSAAMPQQLRIEMQLLAATGLQQLGQLKLAGEVLESALEESAAYTNLRVQALVAIALHHARGMGDPAGAEPWFKRAIAATAKRPGGQIPMDAIPYFNYGLAALEQGRTDAAAGLLETARDLASRDRHLDRLRGRVIGTLGRIALERGDLALARTQLEDAIGMQRAMDDMPGLATSLRQLGELALLESAPAQALVHARESAELVERGRMAEQIQPSFELMSRIHSALGNATESRAWSERARQHRAEAERERDPAIAASLEARAPRPDESVEQLGNLTRARVIGTLALLALAATLLVGGWMLLHARRRQRQLARSSTTDALTGLANRRAATRELDALPAAAGDGLRAALLLLDIDHFKAVNDEHGHEAGDQVLVALGDCLRAACDGNDIVARWGGEEFLVLRPQTSQAAAYALAEHLRAAVERLAIPLSGGQSTSVTVSLGLAPCPYFPGHADWKSAIRMADRALYAAKHSGRNAWTATWGEAAGANVDVYSVRQDPEGAMARGWITVSGSRPVSWSPVRGEPAPRLTGAAGATGDRQLP
ncbi:diguanylate cyclase domain-containing protein [Luteimonas sp. A501]